jgi:hypothetical protein
MRPTSKFIITSLKIFSSPLRIKWTWRGFCMRRGHSWLRLWPKITKFNAGSHPPGDGSADREGFVVGSLFVPCSNPDPMITTDDCHSTGFSDLPELLPGPTPKDTAGDPMSIEALLQVPDNLSTPTVEQLKRPDGFTGRFYQAAWHIIKRDVIEDFNKLWSLDSRILSLLNQAYIVLLQKKEHAVEVGDYPSISLFHSFCKLFCQPG